ncbi:MAG TPA: integrase arm-type DNA-binding domain-containing protein [Burkholderiales bacterium]|nr:integrase arm-type DNA-binding domain-containing protein [Burkholderiales bacterium]
MPHIQNRLTDRNLRALKPDPLQAYDLADGGDLYVRVETSGTVVFWLRYQLNGKRRRWAIGHYGTGNAGISLTEARVKRDEAKKLLRDGIDPWGHKLAEDLVSAHARKELEEAERRGAQRQKQTVAWLVDQFCTIELPAQHKHPKWGEQLLRTHIEKRLQTLPLTEFTPTKLWECLDPLRAKQPATARHVYGLTKKLTAFGLQRGYLEQDPAASIQRRAVAPKPPPRQRVLSDDEIRALWFDFGQGDVSPRVWLGLKLLLVTGQRRGEVTRAERQEFDVDKKRWLIPAGRRGKKKTAESRVPHLVPLSDLALAVLKELFAECGSSVWLLPSPMDSEKPIDERALTRAAARKKWGWTVHDVRRTVRTRLSSLGVSAVVAERVIGHELPDLIAVYDVHAYEKETRAALKKWTRELRRILKI